MAIVKYSGDGAVAKSGKVAGTVFLSNNVVRVWHKTKTVRDTSTNYVKGVFSGISSAFKTLTPAELSTWSEATPNYLRKNALAEVRTLTANQAFQRVNNILTSLGLINVTTAPGIAVTDAITNLTATADDSANTFGVQITTFLAATVIPAGTFVKVYATPQYTASKQKFSKSNFRYLQKYGAAVSIVPLDIYADYAAKFGDPVAGQRIGLAIEWIYATPATTNLFKQNNKIYTDVVVVA